MGHAAFVVPVCSDKTMNRLKSTVCLVGALTLTSVTTAAVAQSTTAPQRSVEQRLRIIEQQLSSQALIAMMQDVRALRREVSALRGENQVLTNKLEKMTQTIRELSGDMERRFQRIGTAPTSSQPASGPQLAASNESGAPAAAPRANTATTATSTAPAPAAAQPSAPGDAQNAYQGAVDKLMAGNYASAVGAFEQFLSQHSASEYAGNARYWLAETYDQQERPNDALNTYAALIEAHPDHHKVPEASLKSAFILDEQGKRAEAVAALQNVLRNYPGSSVEPLARQRLAEIQKR